MKEAVLDKRIHRFLARKERQYPELAQPVNTLTRELDAQTVASPLQQVAKDVNRHDSRQHFRGSRISALQYAQ